MAYDPPKDLWSRVTRHAPCPVCGSPSYCTFNPYAGIAKCMKVEEGSFAQKMSDLGPQFFHRLEEALQQKQYKKVKWKDVPRINNTQMRRWLRVWHERAKLDKLHDQRAKELGLSAESMRVLGVGWANQSEILLHKTRCVHKGYWTVPLYNENLNSVGVALQPPADATGDERDLTKKMISGSKPGMYATKTTRCGGTLLICEGFSDTATAITMGYHAIGRLSNTGTHNVIIAYVEQHLPDTVIVIPDNDPECKPRARELTEMGALNMLDAVRKLKIECVIMKPTTAKDLRQWYLNGGTRNALDKAINNTLDARRELE